MQIHGPVRFIVGAGLPTPKESCTGQISCGSWLASDSGGKVRRVDRVDAIAGKPAPTGGRRHSDLLQELASPAPKSHAPLRFTVGAGKPTPKESCTGQISCGSWLASDSGGKVRWVDRVDAIAGKPTPTKSRASQIYCRGKSSPTKSCATQIYCRSRQAHSQRVMHRSDFLWELACQRCRRRGQACACQVIGGTKLSSSSSTAWMILLT